MLFSRFLLLRWPSNVVLSIGAIVAAAMKKQYVAFEYGASACIYVRRRSVSSYASIFHGTDDLSTLFEYFGPTVGLNLFFVFLRASLMTCHDFHYIAKTATASFFVVCLPALLLAKFMASPQLVTMLHSTFRTLRLFLCWASNEKTSALHGGGSMVLGHHMKGWALWERWEPSGSG